MRQHGELNSPVGPARGRPAGVSWADARERAFAAAPPGPVLTVALQDAVGCVLAADLRTLVPIPAFDTCSMDGWAVCGPGPWELIGQLLPGQAASDRPALRPGQACGVSTGAMLPADASGLLRSEDGRVEGLLLQSVPGRAPDLADLRPRGGEAAADELLVARGATITPPVAGLAASAGHDRLAVVARPRAGLLILGNELLSSGLPGEGRVRDSLGVQLPGWIAAGGGSCTAVRRLGDDAGALAEGLRAPGTDVLVTTGGSARGSGDQVRTVLRELGATVLIENVLVRPGGPMQLARLPDGRLVVALPGNPLAALAGVVTLLWPVLAGLSGPTGTVLPGLPDAVAAVAIDGPRRGAALVPVIGSAVVRPAGHGGSAMLRGIAVASALAVVPAGGVLAGQQLRICPLPW